MENLSFEANKAVVNLIHHSQKKQHELVGSIKTLLKNQLFKGEEVEFVIGGQSISGKISGVSRGDSSSSLLRYNIEIESNIVEGVPFNKIKRVHSFEDNVIISGINKIATKPRGEEAWVVRDQFLSKFGIKDKFYPIFGGKMNGAANDSSSDDEPLVVGVRKSGVGLAPSSSGAKKSPKKRVLTSKMKSPTKKKSDAKVKSPLKAGKNGTAATKLKSQKRLSDFLTPGSENAKESSKSPQKTYDEKMETRAKSINKQVIKSIVQMDIPSLNKILELSAANFPKKFIDKMPNEFVRYCMNKAYFKREQQGKSTEEKAKMRSEKKDLQALNELLFLYRKLFATIPKFEDTWLLNSFDLPELPPIERNPNHFFTCIRLSAFMQSYRQVLEFRNNPSLFVFMDALENGEQGFDEVTSTILTILTDYIRKHQRTIPHFNQGYLSYKNTTTTAESIHHLARKILNPDYDPKAMQEEDSDSAASGSRPETPMETNGDHAENGKVNGNGEKHSGDENDEDMSGDDDEMEIDKQTREDDELCERFCRHKIYELSPVDQARIFELLIQRVEHSGPVRNSMRNTDGDVKVLKERIAGKTKKVDKINKELNEMHPIIPEEEYVNYTRAMTIGVTKRNKERKGLEDQKEELDAEIAAMQDSIVEMKNCSRFRATPIGFDRFHRRYWFFPPTPGLFVEQGAYTTQTPDENAPLALPPKPVYQNFEMTDEQLNQKLNTLLCGGYPSTNAPVKWFHVDSQELLTRLYTSLNSRGVRESELRDAIQKARPVIEASFV